MKSLIEWIYRLFETEEQTLLREQGFIVYCKSCRAILNDMPVEGDGIYRFTCLNCSEISTFDFMAPVPLLVHHGN